jgi:hypothetical protein
LRLPRSAASIRNAVTVSASSASQTLPRALRLASGPYWVTVGAFVLVAGTGFASGGYFPESWGWPMLGAAWAAGLAALGRERTALSRTATAAAVVLAAITVWTLLGVIWSIDVTQTVLEVQRTAVYCAALLAALLWAGRRPERLVHGTWAAIVVLCGWALLTRLVPDRFGVIDTIAGNRLSEPIGYWNSLGLLAGMGVLLGLGLAARAQSLPGRVAGGASLPLLLTTVYFTYSRGAWVALGFGLVACLLLDTRRSQLTAVGVALAPWSALVLRLGYTSSALTDANPMLPQTASQGHRLLLELVGLAAVSGAVAAALRPLEPRLVLPDRLRRAAVVAPVAIAALAAALAVSQFGSPLKIARDGWHAFASSPPAAEGTSLNSRLFHLSGTGRVAQWQVAWRQVEAYPLLGSGAGTYEAYWNVHRPTGNRIRDVHNLYLETLAEQGPVGLLLLATLLVLPLAGAIRARGRPLVAAVCGAYVAYLAHVIVDWDWEIASVTLAFLLCGAMLLSAPERHARPRPARSRLVALAAALVLGGTGLYTIAARLPMQRIGADAAKGQWAAAERNARRASSLAPWSSEPWIAVGEAELNAGRTGDALVSFRKAVAAEPGEWLPWHDLARASTGAEHERALARATALNPLTP